MQNSQLEIVAGPQELAVRAAQLFVDEAERAVRDRGRFTVALSGGSTPKRLYELLADPASEFVGRLAWDKVHFFWSDERHVPPDHADNNFRMVHEAMLAKVLVPSDNIHRIKSELADPAAAARDYEETLIAFFDSQLPSFDLMLLGLGEDAHTASIFPGMPELIETERLMASPWVEKMGTHRITMTMPLINASASVVFLVSGAGKSAALKHVVDGPIDTLKYPAQAVAPTHGSLTWLVDRSASM